MKNRNFYKKKNYRKKRKGDDFMPIAYNPNYRISKEAKNEIIEIFQKMLLEYSNKAYLDITHDTKFNAVPDVIWNCWYGNKNLSVANFEHQYNDIHSDRQLYQFIDDAYELLSLLSLSFDSLEFE
ncbi:MAG: hypothetical protein E6313_04990 [Finegoldia magna]|uniref:Uncharacterized protein n=1 Tax=Finegoldia magna TaxID=1260 RepID=A0A233VMT9_FINMA|nr:hypothetical protein [Finegoldia magna]MDU7140744.1 hypothetical protein [Finegoldia magna]OXZ33712.1 hypothetical protein B9N55_02260 [Finegoldia magna]